MQEQLKVLAVGAHPDDIEILCAGTLTRYVQLGHSVAMVHSCNGRLGHVSIPPDELTDIRRAEAKAAAAVIGAESFCLDIPDLEVSDAREYTERLAGVIRRVGPDVIITHSPNDYMRDHTAIHRLVNIASFAATIPHYEGVDVPAHPIVQPIFEMDTLMGVGFIPDEYVDVTEAMALKREMLACHKSQVEWLRDHDGIDVVGNMEVCARYRGLQCGAEFAEGFQSQQTWPRLSADRILP